MSKKSSDLGEITVLKTQQTGNKAEQEQELTELTTLYGKQIQELKQGKNYLEQQLIIAKKEQTNTKNQLQTELQETKNHFQQQSQNLQEEIARLLTLISQQETNYQKLAEENNQNNFILTTSLLIGEQSLAENQRKLAETMTNWQATKQTLENTQAQLTAQENSQQAKIKHLTKELTQQKQKITTAEQKNTNWQQEKSNLKEQLASKEQELVAKDQTVQNLKNSREYVQKILTQQTKDYEQVASKLVQLQDLLGGKNWLLTNLQKQLVKQEATKQQIQQLTREKEQCKKEQEQTILQWQRSKQEQQAQLAKLQAEKSAQTKQLAHAQWRIAFLEQDKTELKNQLKTEIARMREAEQVNSTALVAKQQQKIQELEQQLKTKEEELNQANHHIRQQSFLEKSPKELTKLAEIKQTLSADTGMIQRSKSLLEERKDLGEEWIGQGWEAGEEWNYYDS